MTMLFVMFGWMLFRAQSWQAAGTMFRGALGLNGFPISSGFAAALRPIEILTLAIGIAIVYLPLAGKLSGKSVAAIDRPPFYFAAALWLWSLWVIQSRTVIPFLYFQF